MSASKYQITTLGVITLVALRLGLGWHFYMEGAKKFRNEGFTAQYFLESATGPFAPLYHGMIADRRGRERLNEKSIEQRWESYRQRVAKHFGFGPEQEEAAQQVFDERKKQLEWYFQDRREDIERYFLELDRLEQTEGDKTLRDVGFERQRLAQKRAELSGQLSVWLGELEKLSGGYQQDLQAVASDQQQQRGAYPLPDPSAMWVDTFVTYLIFGIGVCLILGLFTRAASLAGAFFLFSVIVSQPPWVPGAEETYYQAAEMFALFVLAAFGAGRFAGLDFFIHALRMRCCPPK